MTDLEIIKAFAEMGASPLMAVIAWVIWSRAGKLSGDIEGIREDIQRHIVKTERRLAYLEAKGERQ